MENLYLIWTERFCPMDQDAFVKYYMGLLAQKMAPHGYEPEKLVEAVWKGVGAMVRNSGQQKNETVFWDCFAGTFGAQGATGPAAV